MEPSFLASLSFSILPSLMWIWRLHFLARSSSWVTIIRVRPWFLLRSKRSFSIFSPVLVSRLPVGSSAKMTFGLFTMARAMQTRCFWPPERSLALLLILSSSSTVRMASRARFLRERQPTPAILSGRMTLLRTVSLLFMKNCWKTKPNSRLRRRLSWRVFSLVLFLSLMEMEPEVG